MKMIRWNSDPSVGAASPGDKAWEKAAHNLDTIPTPTPRIYVLPPDDPTGESTVHLKISSHSRSRSEVPHVGKVGIPDVTILDIKTLSKDGSEIQSVGQSAESLGIEEDDLESGTCSSAHSEVHTEESEIPPELPAADHALPEIRPIDTSLGDYVQSIGSSEDKLTYMLSVMIEEVLPRPDSGLLKRMLRMSEIPVGVVEGSGEPILHLRVGSECHISIGLIKINGGSNSPMHISGPHYMKLKPLDGEEMHLNANCEAVDSIEHVSSAIWDLKSHVSLSLTRAATGDSASTVLTPIEMTLGFNVHYHEAKDFIQQVEVKKTFMASMRRELVSLDVDQRFTHDDAVLDLVLSKIELISMPSLLMFLEVDTH